jgi:hypothetical protein
MCKSEAQEPYTMRCRHTGCFACWEASILEQESYEHQRCPACSYELDNLGDERLRRAAVSNDDDVDESDAGDQLDVENVGVKRRRTS